jgi:hypothetical protein
MQTSPRQLPIQTFGAVAVVTLTLLMNTVAEAQISFVNVAEEPAMNLHFERARSAGYQALLQAFEDSMVDPVPIEQIFATTPHRTGGFTGVVLIDHDNDGDTDIYVTNGPGAYNSLFSNQLRDSGSLSFVDIGEQSGAGAFDTDSNGACAGDLDNDGDEDLYVLGRESGNRLYENVRGRFVERSSHGAEGGELSHISCSMGDIDNDGLLDIAVSNAFDLSSSLALGGVPYDLNHANQLFQSDGNLHFRDVSDSSGIRRMSLGGTADPEPPTISWAVTMVDIDRDGDSDIVFGDDQAGLPNAARGGFDRGYVQVFLNDGSGHFDNAPIRLNDQSPAAWMGLGAGDLNCDGSIDLFASNLGDYMFDAMGMTTSLGDEATRWMLGHGDGSFIDPQVGYATAFGWGNAVADLDNDGDQDLLYHGAMDLNAIITHDNPGIVLENRGCTALFTENLEAFRGDYTQRGTQGVAVGDLNQDGYIDVVTASNHRVSDDMPFFVGPTPRGSTLDSTARFYLPMLPDPTSGLLRWGGIETLPGNLTVEINQGSGNAAVSLHALGSVGITDGGRNNRSGIGTIMSFTPHRGDTVSSPITAGASFLSQHALDAHFGLGEAHWGTAEAQWPGGVRNRLYGVRAGESLVLPEIPCSIDSTDRFFRYARCVRHALGAHQNAGTISQGHANRLHWSALIAYFDRRH